MIFLKQKKHTKFDYWIWFILFYLNLISVAMKTKQKSKQRIMENKNESARKVIKLK